LEEEIRWGIFTKHLLEYDENGVITYEREAAYSEYSEINEVNWSVTKTYVDGVLYSETCWDSDTYYYCEE
jgi:hypothetical protein